ncbi:hypothetical protein HPG69_005617 [Diceros bicornis minor]|uniref:Lamin-B2 n=1 Tax=Diceros bicornis minor TaxID=77932 RepID=A0A7J7EIP2_DICBM|nr:hypothetical protein HPG69_005617 [Diceros bicornis minor]
MQFVGTVDLVPDPPFGLGEFWKVSGIKTLYESELADARRVLDETARERAQLQIEIGKLHAELEEASKSSKKREGELVVAQARVKDLESLFQRSEAELGAALSDKRSLEGDVAELRAQLAKAEDGHAVAKKQLEKETLMRVDLENRCQSLQEELDFRKNVFEEEVRETRRRHERRLVEVDSSRQQEYDFKMAQALEELRAQHDEQVRLYKLELEQTYQAKLDNAKLLSDQNDKAASAAREELKEALMRVESLSYQLSGLQKQASAAEDRIRELEETMAGERDKFRKMLDAKEREMTEMRDVMQQQLAEYQELLDVKLALDMEISAYRKLLEGEEERWAGAPREGEERGGGWAGRRGQLLRVEVWAAGAGVAHSPPSTLVWKSQSSWGTGESLRAVLVNADGEEVAMRTVKQSSVVREAENGEEGDEDGAEFGEEDLFHQQNPGSDLVGGRGVPPSSSGGSTNRKRGIGALRNGAFDLDPALRGGGSSRCGGGQQRGFCPLGSGCSGLGRLLPFLAA